MFGHYGVIFRLKSNISWRTPRLPQNIGKSGLTNTGSGEVDDEQVTKFMCVDSEIFNQLCDLFPETTENLRALAIEQREVI